MSRTEKKWILIDCDGVWLDPRMRDGIKNTHYDYANFLMELAILKDQGGYELILLTDRGIGQLAPLVTIFQFSKFQGGESGAVAYNSHSHNRINNPDFLSAIKKIPIIRDRLEKKFPQLALEIGVHSSIRVERHNDDNLVPVFDFLKAEAEKTDDLVCADHGNCLSLKPRNINKYLGLKWLSSLYRQDDCPINFANSFWVGDSASDIPAGEFILENGGKVAGVGNSQKEYREFVLKNKGYMAIASNVRGLIEIIKEFTG